MDKIKLLSIISAALLLGCSSAFSQVSSEPPEPAPPAQQNAPAEKIGPPLNKDERSAPVTGEQPGARSTSGNAETHSPSAGEMNGKGGAPQSGEAGSGLSNEQRTTIMSILTKQKVEPTQLHESARVGERIPGKVQSYPLPPQVVAIYPAWRGYEYIIANNRIVILNPRSREVVTIL
ncbi:MAG TPA: DUF1236 domain-containing protein [Pseudolabrys sp.]|nr:DUF1236 domain-containing protein [Pseudolabrys sp.]